MPNLRTVDDVIARLKNTPQCKELPVPMYDGDDVPGGSAAQFCHDGKPRIALGVWSMQFHIP